MANKVVHVEVVGKDGKALQAFYGRVLGWDIDTNNPQDYGMVRTNGSTVTAGIGAAADGSAGHVTFYVEASDPEAVLREVEKAGGRVLMPLTQVAPDTTIALFADPEGHVVGLM